MNKLYAKLAITNIKKNKLLYIPYIISGIVVISFVYMMSFMKLNKGIDTVYGAETVKAMMSLGLWIVLIFSYIFLFYTNSFLIKRRKKEFGVYNMLGMEKKACEQGLCSGEYNRGTYFHGEWADSRYSFLKAMYALVFIYYKAGRSLWL